MHIGHHLIAVVRRNLDPSKFFPGCLVDRENVWVPITVVASIYQHVRCREHGRLPTRTRARIIFSVERRVIKHVSWSITNRHPPKVITSVEIYGRDLAVRCLPQRKTIDTTR